MRIRLFYPSLLSDWRNDTAHFLRGVAMEWLLRGHEVCVYEPRESHSLNGLLAEYGHGPIARFHAVYPGLASRRYDVASLNVERAVAGASLVIAHELCDPDLVRRLGECQAESRRFRLFFHASDARSLFHPESLTNYDLSEYDGVLAAGSVLREQYLAEGWTERAWTWHEAADTRVFRPIAGVEPEVDVVWVGDWADGERAAELNEFLLEPVKTLGLRARVYGNGYTAAAVAALARAGIDYGGWVPNYELPQVYARARVVVHLPERDFARRLPGVPTSRPLEALACGRPLVCGVWDDTDNLFHPGIDYGLARDGDEMAGWLQVLLHNPEMAEWMARQGHRTILQHHTCAHRVEALSRLCAALPERQAEQALTSDFRRLPIAV